MVFDFKLSIKILLLTIISINNVESGEAEMAALYEPYEVFVQSKKTYKNPFDYNEINFVGEFTSPSGTSFRVSGFYDGKYDGFYLWRIRFMPSIPGKWEYRVFSFKNEREYKKGTFIVSEVPSNQNNHGHVKVDPKYPNYLIYDDGSPHYWIGGKWLTARDYGPQKKEGEINSGIDPGSNVRFSWKSDEQLIQYLDLLAEYKHNGVLLKIGQYPLEQDGISWDLSWIKRGEWLIREALKRGIYVQVNIFDTWSRSKDSWFKNSMDGRSQPFNVWVDGDDNKKRNYIKTIISRLSGFPNVYWELGNEMEHRPNCGECFVKLANEKYIPWIREADPYKLPIGLSEEIWREADVDIGFLHQANSLDGGSWTKPVILNEPVRYDPPLSNLYGLLSIFPDRIRYLYSKYILRRVFHRGLWQNDAINDADFRYTYRNAFWRVFVSGGVGASESTWLNIDKPASKEVRNVMSDHGHLAAIIKKHAILLNRTNRLNGVASIEKHKVSTRGIPGHLYFSYIDAGFGEKVEAATLSLHIPFGHYVGEWYDTKNGESNSFELLVNSDETFIYTPEFSEDISLVLKRVESS